MELFNDDCLNTLKNFEDKSIDCIITDPPYFGIKGDFDFIYKDREHFLEFFETCIQEFKRILKDEGTLIFFGHWRNIAYKQIIADKYFNLVNHGVYEKKDCRTKMSMNNLRCLAPVTERFLIYDNEMDQTGLEKIKLNINNFKPLREYSKKVQDFINLSISEINRKLGHRKAEHFFCHSSSQWEICTQETYDQLIDVFGIDKMEGFLEYSSVNKKTKGLRQEYDCLRRVFNSEHNCPDVLRFSQEAQVTKNFNHPTQKPVKLLEQLIKLVTNENQTVLDPFMGAGSTGVACLNLKRNFIGIELNQEYFEISKNRLQSVENDIKKTDKIQTMNAINFFQEENI